MIRRHIVRPAAIREIRDAVRYYEQQRPGLGHAFEETLDTVIVRILEHPTMYSRVHGEMRRALLHPFPYGVFYKLRGDVLYVVAVTHLARDPRVWQRRR